MSCQNEEVSKQSDVITRVVSFTDEGLLEHVRYYYGTEEIASETYDRRGVLIDRSGMVPNSTVKEYYGNGALKKTVSFKDGNAHGKSIEYYVSGEVFEEHDYCHGLLHGLSRAYRRDGMLWIDEVYKDGILHGVSTSYHDNGNTEIKAQYRDGNLNGSYTKYDRYGCLQERGTYKQGKKDGDYTFYHENGQPARIEKCIEGRSIYYEEFDEDGDVITTTKPEGPIGRR